MGQKQTYAEQKGMSALPPKADICSAITNVRFVPIADTCSATKASLFDHLVGAGEQRPRDGEAKRLGRVQVDHQLERRGLFQWQVGRPRTS